jgi:hypothetical protein
LLADDVGTEIPVWAITVSFVTQLFRQIKYNRDRNAVILPRQGNDRLARFRLYICGINNELPAVSRFDAMKYRTSKASFVAAHSRLRAPRQSRRRELVASASGET